MNILMSLIVIFICGIFVTFMYFDRYTKGFLSKLISVKMKGARGQLVMVNSKADFYWRVGIIDEEWLIYTDRNKNKKRLMTSGATPRRSFGVPVWETDEEKNTLTNNRTVKGFLGRPKEITDETSPNLLVRSYDVVEGHDAVKTDNLYKRIMMAPRDADKKGMIILILLCIIIVLAAYNAYYMTKAINILKELLLAQTPTIVASPV